MTDYLTRRLSGGGRQGLPPPLTKFMYWLVAGGIIGLVLLGIIVFYSLMFKVWCKQYENTWASERWGEKAFSAEQGQCIKAKSVFEF